MNCTGRIAAKETLFKYGATESYDDYQNLNWVPYFKTGSLPSDASQVCGTNTQCLRYYYITKNRVAASAIIKMSYTIQTTVSALGKTIHFISIVHIVATQVLATLNTAEKSLFSCVFISSKQIELPFNTNQSLNPSLNHTPARGR